ncbi:MAG: hypothetical protein EPO58_14090 [Chitinophagaceae bacterium]|nr:MAG: hypothetical protein EPO58_14090 [Chitinophagaceae bacterium]
MLALLFLPPTENDARLHRHTIFFIYLNCNIYAMEDFIIVRAGVNGGKTTTCALLFEELNKQADFAKIYNYRFEEMESLPFNKEGDNLDFIAIIIIGGIIVVIISQGDVAQHLEDILDMLTDKNLIKKLTNGLADSITFIVCCARSIHRKNSTLDMLYQRIEEGSRKELWTVKSENKKDKYAAKLPIVQKIIEHIK